MIDPSERRISAIVDDVEKEMEIDGLAEHHLYGAYDVDLESIIFIGGELSLHCNYVYFSSRRILFCSLTIFQCHGGCILLKFVTRDMKIDPLKCLGLSEGDGNVGISYFANPLVGCLRNVILETSPLKTSTLEPLIPLVSGAYKNIDEHCYNKCWSRDSGCSRWVPK